MEYVILNVFIRVRGFPLRDILSLRALGDGLGQGREIVGASSSSPPPPSASFSEVLGLLGKSCTKWCFCGEFKEQQWFNEGELLNLHRIDMNVWFLYSYGIFIYMEILLKKWISQKWLLCGLHTLWEAGHSVPQPQGVAQAALSSAQFPDPWLSTGHEI